MKKRIEEIKKERESLKAKENFIFNLFLFLIFLILISSLKYIYDLKVSEKNPPFYKGKFLYVYDKKNMEWVTSYKEPYTNKTYLVPFEQHPKEFENYTVKIIKPLNQFPEYIILAYPNETNYSFITKASVNLGRIFNIKGYYSFYYYWPAYITKNNTVKILNRSLKVISQGPLECNLKKALFVVLYPNYNKNEVIINGSCVFIYGNDSQNFFAGVNKATILFMEQLGYNPVFLIPKNVKNYKAKEKEININKTNETANRTNLTN